MESWGKNTSFFIAVCKNMKKTKTHQYSLHRESLLPLYLLFTWSKAIVSLFSQIGYMLLTCLWSTLKGIVNAGIWFFQIDILCHWKFLTEVWKKILEIVFLKGKLQKCFVNKKQLGNYFFSGTEELKKYSDQPKKWLFSQTFYSW